MANTQSALESGTAPLISAGASTCFLVMALRACIAATIAAAIFMLITKRHSRTTPYFAFRSTMASLYVRPATISFTDMESHWAMGITTEISWTHSTFNPWIGCTNVSPGCDHCYAESMARRFGWTKWGNNPRKRTSAAYWRQPLRWNVDHVRFFHEHKCRQRVFCASLADVFDNQVPKEWRDDLWNLIHATPNLDWLLLTKRPQNIRKMLPDDWGKTGYQNVWLGTTAEDQPRFDQRWKILSGVSAIITFISYEPAIGPLRLPFHGPYPHWLISGGESGGRARALNPQWIRDIIADCRRCGVAPFHKQWGTYRSNPLVVEKGLSLQEAERRDQHGKGGGLLDDALWREFPQPGVPTMAPREAA
jgi:protein gp37